MKKVKYYLLFLLIGSINSFSQEITHSKNFSVEIPTYKDGEQELFYKLTKQKTTQLKLKNLEKGYDSLQIRIWYHYSLSSFQELVILKYTNSKWWGIHYNFTVNWDAHNLTETIIESNKEYIFPEKGWENFIKKLLDKKITELPNMRDIDSLKDYWTDGTTYCIEISTLKNYRFYSYHLPKMFPNYWQTKNLADIIDLIQLEFNLANQPK